MGNILDYQIEIITNEHPEFYRLIGPFLARREIAKEIGEPYEPFWDEDGKLWFVAMRDGTVLGFATLLPKKTLIQFGEAYILPAYRKQGIYAHLIDARLAHCPTGATVQVLVCSSSIKQYITLGFTLHRERGKRFSELRKTMGAEK